MKRLAAALICVLPARWVRVPAVGKEFDAMLPPRATPPVVGLATTS